MQGVDVTGVKRSLLAVTISLLLVATAVASLWLMASAGVFDAEGGTLPHAATDTTPEAGDQFSAAAGAARLVQPRDPFRPLVDPPSTTRTVRCPRHLRTQRTGSDL